MLLEGGRDAVSARHQRLAAAARTAVQHWGLEVLCLEPSEYSPVLTAVLMPPGHDADQFRKTVLDNYNMSRSEEHTSELQSPDHLVCRLLLEKKKKHIA